jgi:hypothetical protein
LTTSTVNRREIRWASIALDIQPRKPLYRLFASLSGFVIEAIVCSDDARTYACFITLDGCHVPSSPAGGFKTLEGAISAAKETFAEWAEVLLRRV